MKLFLSLSALLWINVVANSFNALNDLPLQFQSHIYELDNNIPTVEPTVPPTVSPEPSHFPTIMPTFSPSLIPTTSPSTTVPTEPRIPTRRPTRIPTTYEPSSTPVPSTFPTVRPTQPLPIIFANVQQFVTLDDRVDVNNASVIDVFRTAIATSAELTTERIQNVYFLGLNATTTSTSRLNLRKQLSKITNSLFHRSLLPATKSYKLFYSIHHLQTASFVTASSITGNIINAIKSGAFATTLLSVASTNSIDLFYVVNVTTFDSALVVTDLTPTNSPTKSPAEIFGSDFAGLDTQTQLIVGVTVGVVGLVLFMAFMAFLSLFLRRNCEDIKRKRVEERQERRRQDAAATEGVTDKTEQALVNPEDANHVLGRRHSSLMDESFYTVDAGSPPPQSSVPRRLSKFPSHSSRNSSGSGADFSSRGNSPNRSSNKILRSRNGSRMESMYGSDYGSFAGLNDSYQRPVSAHGSDYGFTGIVDVIDNSSHSRAHSPSSRPLSRNNSVASLANANDPAGVEVVGPPLSPQQVQMLLLQQQFQQQQMLQQQAMQNQMFFLQQQQQGMPMNMLMPMNMVPVGIASYQPIAGAGNVPLALYVTPLPEQMPTGFPPRPLNNS